ncbi:MAG: DegQ family serine endoprotease [Pseudomonadales bacterium]
MPYRQLTLLSVFLFLLTPPLVHAQATDAAEASAIESLRETGKAFASVARAVSPSVVFISVEGGRQPQQFAPDDFLRRFFGDQFPGAPRQQPPQGDNRVLGQGSGFVFEADSGLLSDRSYIMTNNHVVENAERIRVRFQDGREFDATVKGTDPQSDVAVIEIPTAEVRPLPLANSAELEVGEWVVAIGSPFGLRSTLTVGVVSATGRTSVGINDYEDFIQTDAAINPGNSGGPLVNLSGEVVGMNTAIFSRSGGYMGIGFAIPIDLAKSIAAQLIDGGSVSRGFLGVSIQPLTPELAESFGIDRNEGILVAQVSKDSPAQRAGIEVGDVIVGFQGKPVQDTGDFRNRVALTAPDSKADLTVLRDGKRRTLKVSIGALADAGSVARSDGAAARDVGMAVQTPTAQMAQQLGIEPGAGVVVTQVSPGSPAARVGITPGTVVLQVNRQTVASAEAFYQAIESSTNRRAVLLVRSGDAQQYVVLNW